MNIYPFLRTKQQKAYNFRRLLFSFCSIIFLRINKYVVKKRKTRLLPIVENVFLISLRFFSNAFFGIIMPFFRSCF